MCISVVLVGWQGKFWNLHWLLSYFDAKIGERYAQQMRWLVNQSSVDGPLQLTVLTVDPNAKLTVVKYGMADRPNQ